MVNCTGWKKLLPGLMLVASVSVFGCGGGPEPVEDGPPPEVAADGEACAACGMVECVCEPGAAEACSSCGEDACACPKEAAGCEDCGTDACVCPKEEVVEEAAAVPGAVDLVVAMGAEGEPATVSAGGAVLGTLGDGNVPDAVVSFLEEQVAAAQAAGATPHVAIHAPPGGGDFFQLVVEPLMRASFRAGYPPTEVEYKPVIK